MDAAPASGSHDLVTVPSSGRDRHGRAATLDQVWPVARPRAILLALDGR